jgi:hypothetical protein
VDGPEFRICFRGAIEANILESAMMNRTQQDLPDPTELFGDMIDLTSQAHAASVNAMMNHWEGGLDFFANLLKHAEEVTARSGALFQGKAH